MSTEQWRRNSAGRLTARGWLILVQAALLTMSIRIALWVFPAVPLVRRVRNRVESCSARENAPPLDQIAWSVRAAGRRVPRATCLVQALSMQLLLAHYGYKSALQIGVAKIDGTFEAHAWVEADGRIVVGARTGMPFTPLPDLSGLPNRPRER